MQKHYYASTRTHAHASLPHRLRMEETLDQTELINNSWEMVAQPSCLQPQTPTTTVMLNTHTHHSSHPAYSLQTQWLRHAGTYFSPQRRHPPSAELLTQTGCLRASWVCIPNCEAQHVWRFRETEGIYCHSATEALIYSAQESGEALCGTVSVCMVKAPFWMGFIQMSAIKRLLGIQLRTVEHTHCIDYIDVCWGEQP